MSLPREPRQKMINMMYLVLTALLALNVSSEILNAFKTVNKSLETTNATVNKSTETILQSLADKEADPATQIKAAIWRPKALQAQTLSKDVYNYIQTLKDRILKEAGGDPKNPNQKFKEDNLDIGTRVMIEKGEGQKLLKMLGEYKKNVLAIDPKIKTEFETTLPINLEKPKSSTRAGKTWEGAYFHMVPTVAALTILSKFQMDVKTSENRVVQFCHNEVGQVQVRFDTYAAFAQASTNYVMPGDEMEITAGIGAFSKNAKPTITIDGQNVALDVDGAAHRKMSAAASLGKHMVNVKVDFVDLDGKPQTITKQIEYTVGQSAASIALDKMNVLYIGVDNPVSISATSGGSEKLQVSMTGGGGTISKISGGSFNARVTTQSDDCWINVSVDGKLAGKAKFRVRNIPPAQAYVGGQPSGANIAAGAFKAQGGVGAGIKDFPFQLDYNVMSFTFTCDTDDGDIATENGVGAEFTGAVRRAINEHVKAGKMVTIDNIRVKGPDGRTLPAPSLIYYIK